MSFFSSKGDPKIKQDMIIQQPTLFASKQLYAGSGVASIVSNVVTFTPATAPGWTASAFVSTTALNFVVAANNGKVFSGKVSTNTTTAVSFDASLAKEVSSLTGAVGAGTDFTAATTYFFYILEPHATSLWGDYLGECKEIEVTPKYDFARFENAIPSKLIRQDLVSVDWSMKAKVFQPSNQNVLHNLWNTNTAGDQTTYFEEQITTTPATLPFFRLSAIGFDVTGRDYLLQFFLAQFTPQGAIALSTKDHKGISFSVGATADNLRTGADIGLFRRLLP
jgi:hypothetical protein